MRRSVSAVLVGVTNGLMVVASVLVAFESVKSGGVMLLLTSLWMLLSPNCQSEDATGALVEGGQGRSIGSEVVMIRIIVLVAWVSILVAAMEGLG